MSTVQPARRPRLRVSRVNHEAASRAYRHAAVLAHILLTGWSHRDWRGAEKLPQTGGVLIVCNHVSRFDPIAFGDYLIWSGRWPRFLAKVVLFRSKLIGWLLRSAECVPVDRASPHAAAALGPAEERLAEGKAVVIYPEGTETHDPELWPMVARTGAARLALATRVPVVPCAVWGPQHIIPPLKNIPLRPFGQTFSVICGDPVDLSEFYDREITPELLRLVTTRLLDAITVLLEDLRQERAPAERWDRKAGQRLPVVR